jgi:hypothetical protein
MQISEILRENVETKIVKQGEEWVEIDKNTNKVIARGSSIKDIQDFHKKEAANVLAKTKPVRILARFARPFLPSAWKIAFIELFISQAEKEKLFPLSNSEIQDILTFVFAAFFSKPVRKALKAGRHLAAKSPIKPGVFKKLVNLARGAKVATGASAASGIGIPAAIKTGAFWIATEALIYFLADWAARKVVEIVYEDNPIDDDALVDLVNELNAYYGVEERVIQRDLEPDQEDQSYLERLPAEEMDKIIQGIRSSKFGSPKFAELASNPRYRPFFKRFFTDSQIEKGIEMGEKAAQTESISEDSEKSTQQELSDFIRHLDKKLGRESALKVKQEIETTRR